MSTDGTSRSAGTPSTARHRGGTDPDLDAGVGASEQVRFTQERFTDVGNSRRLVTIHGCDILYCPELGWLSWDGCRWLQGNLGIVERAKATARSITFESRSYHDSAQQKAANAWAKASEFKRGITAMIDLAKSDPRVLISADQLDRDPNLLNVLNGTVDLRTGKLLVHRREDYITKVAPVMFDADTSAPLWEQFLRTTFDGDDELIAFVQRAMGYSLTGHVRKKCFFVLCGSGDNGKTTFLEVFRGVTGEYAMATSSSTLMERRRGDGAREDLARLRGARFVTASETGQGGRLDEETVKSLTGGDRIPARFLYRGTFEFEPQFKLWLATNHKPEIRGTDHAIWTRVRLIGFGVQIAKKDQTKGLKQELLEMEAPGILAWAVRGAVEWYRQGLGEAKTVEKATMNYREEMDAVGSFLKENCEARVGCWTPRTSLYESYRWWAISRDGSCSKATDFYTVLRNRGFAENGRNGTLGFKGLGLRSSEHEPSRIPAFTREKISQPRAGSSR